MGNEGLGVGLLSPRDGRFGLRRIGPSALGEQRCL